MKRYLVVYDVVGDVCLAITYADNLEVEKLREKPSVYHVVELPLGSTKCVEVPVDELIALEDEV